MCGLSKIAHVPLDSPTLTLKEVALTGLFVDYIDKKIRKMIHEVGRGVTQRVWEKLEGGGDARDQNTLYTHMKPSENRELKQVFKKNHIECIAPLL